MLQLGQIIRNRLAAFAQVAFDHRADERFVASDTLLHQTVPNVLLTGMLLGGIGVAAIHH